MDIWLYSWFIFRWDNGIIVYGSKMSMWDLYQVNESREETRLSIGYFSQL